MVENHEFFFLKSGCLIAFLDLCIFGTHWCHMNSEDTKIEATDRSRPNLTGRSNLERTQSEAQ